MPSFNIVTVLTFFLFCGTHKIYWEPYLERFQKDISKRGSKKIFQKPVCKVSWLTDTNYLAVVLLFNYFFTYITGKNFIFVKPDNIYLFSQNVKLLVKHFLTGMLTILTFHFSNIIGIICLVPTFNSHSSMTYIFSNSYLKAILSSSFLSIECTVWAVTFIFTFPLDYCGFKYIFILSWMHFKG